MSAATPSSTPFKIGCSASLAFLAAGLIALAVAAVASIATAAQWWRGNEIQNRWPRAEAVIKECRVVTHEPTLHSRVLLTNAECAIVFDAGGRRVEGGLTSRPAGEPGELQAWVAQHPPGTRIAVHYDPQWPPTAVPEGPPELFDVYSTRIVKRAAMIAGVSAALLLGLAFLLRRR